MLHRFSKSVNIDKIDDPAVSTFLGNRSDMEREFPLVQIHDEVSADIKTAMAVGEELCNITGALLDVHLRTDHKGGADEVWDEDPDPTYWEPILLKGFFPPGAIEVALKTWGADAPIKLDVYFSIKTLMQKLGKRVLRPGDVVFVPFNAIGNITPKYFRILNATPIGNYKYVWVYLKCSCESLTSDITVQPRSNAVMSVADYQDE